MSLQTNTRLPMSKACVLLLALVPALAHGDEGGVPGKAEAVIVQSGSLRLGARNFLQLFWISRYGGAPKQH